MSKKIMLLALVAVSAAMFALPAVASAGTWHAEPSVKAEAFTISTAGHKNATLTTVNRTVTCTETATVPAVTGSGSYNVGGTTGTLSLTFHNCHSLGTACTTPGQTSGTIVTSPNLVIHNILLEKVAPRTPAIKITGAGESTQLAHFICGFGLVTINVTGTIIGRVTHECDQVGEAAETNPIQVDFETEGGVQKWTQETTTGTKTDLTATVNGTPETGGQTGTGTVTFGGKKTIKCT